MSFIPLADIEQIEEGKIHTVDTKYIRIGITKIGDSYYAFEDTCSHDGQSIAEGQLDGCLLTCPRHFAQFDLQNGEALCMPATEPIPIFAVRQRQGKIEVDLEE